jgi:hypothetical protein
MTESNRTPANESPHEAFPQPIDLLRRLASARLPIRVVDNGDIETLRILKLAGSIKAAIPEATRLPGGLNQPHRQLPATVDEITRIGRSLLSRFASRRTLAHSYPQFL